MCYSHVLLQDDGLTEQSNLKPSEGYMWSGDELIVSVVFSTCMSPRQHKTTPAAQFIHKHVHVRQSNSCIALLLHNKGNSGGSYKYGEEHCCCF